MSKNDEPFRFRVRGGKQRQLGAAEGCDVTLRVTAKDIEETWKVMGSSVFDGRLVSGDNFFFDEAEAKVRAGAIRALIESLYWDARDVLWLATAFDSPQPVEREAFGLFGKSELFS